MRISKRLFAVTAAVTATVIGLAAAPASAATIQAGHVDILDIDYASGALTLDIKTYNPANDDLSPAGTILRLLPSSAITVPSGSAWTCLGTAGSTVYVGPQAEDTNLLWAGWNTEDVPAAQGPIKMELVSVSSVPAGGRLTLYTTNALGVPTYRLNSNTAAGCPISTWPGNISAGTHAHGNWAFSALGTYTLVFRATAQGGAGVASPAVSYTVQVG
ncbi:choice-of-anchor M domain-containing protein [Rhizomonospora bruguierae]|uniref:choice-of-anchor M domain-containing protein n=1 Tax=Rhizomonospora bruguierae TaxID=1581705 RepID=UPI001BCF06C1|nr:choice-of-anchor M domain-containing protein [Micromonospora sp. NBRC 107566]